MPADTIIKKFDSPGAFLEWAATAPVQWQGVLSSHQEGNTEWAGTRTFEEAYDLAKFGWQDGLKLLRQYAARADMALAEKRATGRNKIIGFEGYHPHIPRAVAGEMPNMVRTLKPKRDNRGVVKIRYDIGRQANVSAETILRFGGALCSYINMLEASNYSVELDAFSESAPSHRYGNGPNISFQFPMKKAGTSLSMIDMVFWLAHPAALRRIEFAAMEKLDVEQWYSSGYGRAQPITTPPGDTLYLRIDDAGRNVKEGLENIRRKHMAMLEPQSPLVAQISKLELV